MHWQSCSKNGSQIGTHRNVYTICILVGYMQFVTWGARCSYFAFLRLMHAANTIQSQVPEVTLTTCYPYRTVLEDSLACTCTEYTVARVILAYLAYAVEAGFVQ